MKKIILLLILLLPLSGCGKTSLKAPAEQINLKQDGYYKRSIYVGEQLQPGNITININEANSDRFFIYLIQGDSYSYYSVADNKFKPFVWDKYDWMSDVLVRANKGDSITLPEEIPDNSILTIDVVHPYAHGYFPEEARDMSYDIDVISDCSGEYDDSYKTTGGRTSLELDLNRHLNFSQNYGSNLDMQSLVVGEDISGGYMSITCVESETGSCEVIATTSMQATPLRQYGDRLYIPLGKINVGETYVISTPMANGMIINLFPSISSTLDFPDMQRNLNQKIKIKMLSELPQQEQNTEDSNN